ncbi:hypothetical protein NEFER03_1469 [Nematocida sp. LUAm3]|nr:hypothetical protein NEFER03_1469 [Nematocida sp. LUAm3]KAI5174701.1 hypothetical protein NEFER02_0811 [Nematocida sp. LUAm2]KAI5177888.1 hypothetical protein NEFER01_1090 [Nematocida sp. LUAm1]
MEQQQPNTQIVEKLIDQWKEYAHKEKEKFIKKMQRGTNPTREVSFREEPEQETEALSPKSANKETRAPNTPSPKKEQPVLAQTPKKEKDIMPSAKKNQHQHNTAKKEEEKQRKVKEAEEKRRAMEEQKRAESKKRAEERKTKAKQSAKKKQEEKAALTELPVEKETKKAISMEKEELRVKKEEEKKKKEEKKPESIFAMASAQINKKEGENSLVFLHPYAEERKDSIKEVVNGIRASEEVKTEHKTEKNVKKKVNSDVQRKQELKQTKETLPPSVLSSACSSTSSESFSKKPFLSEGKDSTSRSSLEKMPLDPSTTQKTEIRLTAHSSFEGLFSEKQKKEFPEEEAPEERKKESFKRVLPNREELDKVMTKIAPYLNDELPKDKRKKDEVKQSKRIECANPNPNQSFANLKPDELKEKTQGLKMLLNSIKGKGKEKTLSKAEHILISPVKKPEILQKMFSPVMESSDEDNKDPKYSKKKWVDSPSMPRRLLLQDENQATTIFGPSINTKVNLKEMFSGIANLPADSPKKFLDPK